MKNKNESGAVDMLKRLKEEQSGNTKTPSLSKYMSQTTKKETVEHLNNFESYLHICEVDTSDIIRWKYKDRPENELGNIDELAKTFLDIGQQQPCIVRPLKNNINKNKYELIVGERRWKAAESLNIPLKVIIQELSDRDASLIQAVENENRKDLSEYAKGMSYYNKIEAGILKQKDLIDILGISKQQVSRLLSFGKIHDEVKDEIKSYKKISARTAEEIKRLSLKSEKHRQALLKIKDRIGSGKLGANKLNSEVERIINSDSRLTESSTKKVMSQNGRHLFTWRKDNNHAPSIHFPKDITTLIQDNKIDFEQLTEDLEKMIDKHLKRLE